MGDCGSKSSVKSDPEQHEQKNKYKTTNQSHSNDRHNSRPYRDDDQRMRTSSCKRCNGMQNYIVELSREKANLTKHMRQACAESEDHLRRYKEVQQNFSRQRQELEQLRIEKDNQLPRYYEMRKHIDQLSQEKEKLTKELHKTCAESKDRLRRCNRLKQENVTLRQEIEKLSKEKEHLLSRLSAAAAVGLTDGNPDIADLSDENRPTKIAEKFGELYDNEWTEALEVLSSANNKTEKETCTMLYQSLLCVYASCVESADKDLKAVIKSLENFRSYKSQSRDILSKLKEERRKAPVGDRIKILVSENREKLALIISDPQIRNNPKVDAFLTKSTELCWYMAVQEPPVFIETTYLGRGDVFNKKLFKPYTRTGKLIDFIVWPTLYLHEGGSILRAGIAQGKTEEEQDIGSREEKGENVSRHVKSSGTTDFKQNSLETINKDTSVKPYMGNDMKTRGNIPSSAQNMTQYVDYDNNRALRDKQPKMKSIISVEKPKHHSDPNKHRSGIQSGSGLKKDPMDPNHTGNRI